MAADEMFAAMLLSTRRSIVEHGPEESRDTFQALSEVFQAAGGQGNESKNYRFAEYRLGFPVGFTARLGVRI